MDSTRRDIEATIGAIVLMGLMTVGAGPGRAGTFGEDLAFLKEHTDVLVLQDKSGAAQVAVVPRLQGRIMTSSLNGPDGVSIGWINHDLIASGEIRDHFNPNGGEDRFWLGPEAGQYGLYFAPGDPFDLDHWQTPAEIDTVGYDLVSATDDTAVFTKAFDLTNYAGTKLSIKVDRKIKLLSAKEVMSPMGISLAAGTKMVAFQSVNRITNTGDNEWTKEGGQPSVWILGMFNPSKETTVVVPFVKGDETELGPIVNDTYFGKVPADRLVVKDEVLFFSGDGTYRSKIGLSPRRARPVLGSYDAANRILTLVSYTKPEGETRYVNSMWEIQDEPYGGDTVNSYNDGPPEPGVAPLGPFYELETSSPAAGLRPGESLTHTHRTVHFQGAEADLDAIAKKMLGVGLDAITSALK